MMPTLLIIEDDHLVHEQLLKNFQSWGWKKLLSAYNSDEAAAIYLRSKPDLLLVDIELPGKFRDGIEFVESLRKKGDDVPVIYLSGVSNEALLERAQKTEPESILSKLSLDFYLKPNIINILEKSGKFPASTENGPLQIFVLDSKRLRVPILLDDIICVKSEHNTSCLYLTNGKRHCLTKPIKRFLADLPRGNSLARINRSWAINLKKIAHIEPKDRHIKMKDFEEPVPIGETYFNALRKKLGF